MNQLETLKAKRAGIDARIKKMEMSPAERWVNEKYFSKLEAPRACCFYKI